MNDPVWEKHFETRSECASYWRDKSSHLRQASKTLSESGGGGCAPHDAGATYRMLMGMSFELLFKAFAVARKQQVVFTHDIADLAVNVGFNLDDKEKYIFCILSGYIIWEGRYPVPKISKKVSGPDGIKTQWERFSSNGSNTISLDQNDLDYENLYKIWNKYNKIYLKNHIGV